MRALRWSVIVVVGLVVIGCSVLASGLPDYAVRYYWQQAGE